MTSLNRDDIKPGLIVFGRVTTFPWWPAIVSKCPRSGNWCNDQKYWCFFFNDSTGAWLKPTEMRPFDPWNRDACNETNSNNPKYKRYLARIAQAISVAQEYLERLVPYDHDGSGGAAANGGRDSSPASAVLAPKAILPKDVFTVGVGLPPQQAIATGRDGRETSANEHANDVVVPIVPVIPKPRQKRKRRASAPLPAVEQTDTPDPDEKVEGLDMESGGRPRRKRTKSLRYQGFVDPFRLRKRSSKEPTPEATVELYENASTFVANGAGKAIVEAKQVALCAQDIGVVPSTDTRSVDEEGIGMQHATQDFPENLGLVKQLRDVANGVPAAQKRGRTREVTPQLTESLQTIILDGGTARGELFAQRGVGAVGTVRGGKPMTSELLPQRPPHPTQVQVPPAPKGKLPQAGTGVERGALLRSVQGGDEAEHEEPALTTRDMYISKLRENAKHSRERNRMVASHRSPALMRGMRSRVSPCAPQESEDAVTDSEDEPELARRMVSGTLDTAAEVVMECAVNGGRAVGGTVDEIEGISQDRLLAVAGLDGGELLRTLLNRMSDLESDVRGLKTRAVAAEQLDLGEDATAVGLKSAVEALAAASAAFARTRNYDSGVIGRALDILWPDGCAPLVGADGELLRTVARSLVLASCKRRNARTETRHAGNGKAVAAINGGQSSSPSLPDFN